MRIAVISDTHLPAVANSVQEASLHWAVDHVIQHGADLLISAGDLTASGDLNAAHRALAELKRAGIPFRGTVGNAEWREPATAKASIAALTQSDMFKNEQCAVILIDTSTTHIDMQERRRVQKEVEQLSGQTILLITHMPPRTIAEDSRAWLESSIAKWPIDLMVCGHGHRYLEFEFGGKPARMVCGLDPEKAYEGPPAISWLIRESDGWRHEQVPFPGALLDDWTTSQRNEMSDLLGVSCVEADQTLEHLERLIELDVECVELRAEALHLPGLDQLVSKWRGNDERVLSVHLPNIYWNDGQQSKAEKDIWETAYNAANDLDAAQMTLHPPRLAMDVYQNDPSVLERLADRVLPYLQKTTAPIAVENLHMSPQHTPDQREFACLPDEVLAWRDALRQRLGTQRVGNLLDLGHARANGIYSSTVSLGHWFATLGQDIIGYHLHQLDPDTKIKRCHFPITGIYGPGIAYGAFSWARSTGQIARKPIFLEVRGEEDRLRSLALLRDVLAQNPTQSLA